MPRREQWDDMRMLQLGSQLDFAPEPLDVNGGGQVRRQHLDDDLASQRQLLGEVHPAHSASAELSLVPKNTVAVEDEAAAKRVMRLIEALEDNDDVQEILEYPEQSAGRLMSPDFIAVNERSTVEQAIDHIRKSISEERAFELYVTDEHGHMVRVVPLRRPRNCDCSSRFSSR